MAEPRKPRVIKTRPGTTPPRTTTPQAATPGTTPPEAAGVEATTKGAARVESAVQPSALAPPGVDAAATPAAGAVRHTSSKVSVEPLPSDKAATSETASSKVAPSRPASSKAAPSKAAVSKPGVSKSQQSKPSSLKSLKLKVGPAKLLPSKGGPSKAVPAQAEPSKTSGGQDGPIAQVLAFPVPRFKRRRRTIVYSVAGIVTVLALVMSFALFSPVLAVKSVVFDGQKLVDPKILEHAVAPIFGKPLPQITAEEIQTLLGQVVQVKSSSIEARPPSTLHVRIVERIPVALLKNEDSYLLVDQEGVELGTTTDPASVSLPLIDGGKAVIGQDTFNAMTEVLANLPQSILSQLANATAASPDAVELKLVDGRSVIWGDASDMELKAVVLESLLNATAPTPEAGAPAPAPVNVFDVSAPRRPVTR